MFALSFFNRIYCSENNYFIEGYYAPLTTTITTRGRVHFGNTSLLRTGYIAREFAYFAFYANSNATYRFDSKNININLIGIGAGVGYRFFKYFESGLMINQSKINGSSSRIFLLQSIACAKKFISKNTYISLGAVFTIFGTSENKHRSVMLGLGRKF